MKKSRYTDKQITFALKQAKTGTRKCSTLVVERSSVRYISHKPDLALLVMRIRDLAATRTTIPTM